MGDLSIIIVNWNAREYLRNCLTSIAQHGGDSVREIIVVDNASTDGSPEMVIETFPNVKIVKPGTNLGFAKANNLGIAQSTGSLVALINSDVLLHPECLQTLQAFLAAHPRAGAVAPRIVGGDGHIQLSAGSVPTVWNTAVELLLLNRFFSRYAWGQGVLLRRDQHEHTQAVGILSGCFLVVRRTTIEEAGLLDEGFFFYAEDVDWCKRIGDRGWELFIVAEASATHFGGGSSAAAPVRYSIEMVRANLIYWQKHHGRSGRWFYLLLAGLQHASRLCFRGLMILLRIGGGSANRRKIQEHWACLCWLIAGKEIR